jgi:hypothetical protein
MYRKFEVELDSFDSKVLEFMTEVQLAQMMSLLQDACTDQDLLKKVLVFKPVLNTIFRQLKKGISNVRD